MVLWGLAGRGAPGQPPLCPHTTSATPPLLPLPAHTPTPPTACTHPHAADPAACAAIATDMLSGACFGAPGFTQNATLMDAMATAAAIGNSYACPTLLAALNTTAPPGAVCCDLARPFVMRGCACRPPETGGADAGGLHIQ